MVVGLLKLSVQGSDEGQGPERVGNKKQWAKLREVLDEIQFIAE